MKKGFVFLAVILLLGACSPSPSGAAYVEVEALPTLTIDYQVVGSTKNTYMVVVDPQVNSDRDGLLSIGRRLCQSSVKCKVWFWDDGSKVDTTYPVDPEKEQALIAMYTSDLYAGTSELKMYTLGDPH